MEEPIACVAGCRYISEMIPDAPWVIDWDWIEKHHITLVVQGSEYSEEDLKLNHSVPISMGIFRTVPYTPGISTTEIIRRRREDTARLV